MSEAIQQGKVDSAERFKKLLTPHSAERDELLAAGVSAHRVNALYPLDFKHAFEEVTGHLLAQGMDQFGLEQLSAEQWRSSIASALALRVSFEGLERSRYESGWTAHYGAANLNIYVAFQQNLFRLGHTYYDADYFAGWYGRALFMGYWLLQNPALPQASSLAFHTLMQWIAAKVLPKTIA